MNKTIRRRSTPSIENQFSEEITPFIQRILLNRGVSCDVEIEKTLNRMLPVSKLKGVDEAVHLLGEAMERGESILVVGDFDADGATSSTLSVLAFRALGHQKIDYLVPNRFEYGYGLTPEIVEVAKTRNPQMIMTVDNGIASISGVKAAKEAGIKVLVTDHHLPADSLPEADAIVNPNQPGCSFPSKNLAGVGVVFYLMVALRSHLRDIGWFERHNIAEPNMAQFLDLVALGTVADVVPLDANNRLLVHQGLARIRAGKTRPGIEALIAVASRNQQNLQATDLGFALGPRINAAGRLDDITHGIECLLADDAERAKNLAYELDSLNRERKEIELGMRQEAMAALERIHLSENESLPTGICLYDPTWHQGVIGILASRIKERFHRPVIIFAEASETEMKGSARSIPGFHIRDALDAVAARHPGLLSKFGGHAMAAGMSLDKDKFAEFAAAFDEEAQRHLSADDLHQVVLSDGELTPKELTLKSAYQIQNFGPWGQAFPEPVFDGYFELIEQRIVGGHHLKMVFGVKGTNQIVDGIAFNIDTDQWPNKTISQVHVAYKLDVNEFRGRKSLQLMVEHLQPA